MMAHTNTAVNSRRGCQAVLLAVIVVFTLFTFSISLCHQTIAQNLPSNNNLHSLSQEQPGRVLVCPSNVGDMLESQRDEPEALPWDEMSYSIVRYCPLINNPIFHNHPFDGSIASRLLIFVSHRLSDDRAGEWLFFAGDTPISIQQAWINLQLQNDTGTDTHLFLKNTESIDKLSCSHCDLQQPLQQTFESHLSIVAIQISIFSKELLERVLMLRRSLETLTETEAISAVAAEYEYTGGVRNIHM